MKDFLNRNRYAIAASVCLIFGLYMIGLVIQQWLLFVENQPCVAALVIFLMFRGMALYGAADLYVCHRRLVNGNKYQFHL